MVGLGAGLILTAAGWSPVTSQKSSTTTGTTRGAVIQEARGGQTVLDLTPVGAEAAWAATVSASSAGGSQSVVRTTDGGTGWQVLTPPGLTNGRGDDYISDTDFLDVAHAWISYGGAASGSPRTLTSTSDGGRRWSTLGRLPSSECSLQFVNSTDGWCVSVLGAAGSEAVTIYRSTDGGREWKFVSASPTPGGASGTAGSLPIECDKDVAFVTPVEGWAGFDCPNGLSPLYESTDGGHTWTPTHVAAPPATYTVADGYPADWSAPPTLSGTRGAAGLYVESVGGGRSLIYRTVNGGRSWQAVPPPGSPRNWEIDVVNATHWKLTSGGTILATDNAGSTWKSIKSDVSFAPQSLPNFVTANIGWYEPGASGEQIVRTTDGGRTWRQVQIPGVGP